MITVLWMIFIFSMSAAPASVSGNMSGGLSVKIMEKIYPNYNILDTKKQSEIIDKSDHIIRKAAHFFEYTVLGILIFTSFYLSVDFSYKNRYHSLIALLCLWFAGIFYAVSDEIHQVFVPGRSGQISDVALDSVGILFGIVLIWMIIK